MKHIVTYVGNGIWKDKEGISWIKKSNGNPDIITTKDFSDNELNSRDDIKFMIGYDAMIVHTVSLDIKNEQDVKEVKENTSEKPVEEKTADTVTPVVEDVVQTPVIAPVEKKPFVVKK